MTGTVLAQGLVYMTQPVLTRIYDPEFFGIMGFYIAFSAVFASFATGRMESAIMLPKRRVDALHLLVIAIIFLLVVAGSTSIISLFAEPIALFFNEPAAAPYLKWVPAGVFLLGAIRTLDVWFSRSQEFGLQASGKVAQGVVKVITQLAGKISPSADGLIAGWIAGFCANIIVLGHKNGRKTIHQINRVFSVDHAKKLISRYKDFPLFSAPAAGLNTLSTQTPALLLLYYFDASIVGFYTACYAVLGAPMGVIGSAVSQVFFVEAATAKIKGTLKPLTENVYQKLVMIGIWPAIVIVIAGPTLFLVLGDNWAPAGEFAQLLAPWLFFVFVSSPLSRLFDVQEKQRALLVYNVFLIVTRVASIMIGGYFQDPMLAVFLYGSSGGILWMLHTFWMLKMGDSTVAFGVRILIRYLLPAIPCGILLFWIENSEHSLYLTGFIAIAAGGLYAGLVKWLDRTKMLEDR